MNLVNFWIWKKNLKHEFGLMYLPYPHLTGSKVTK